MLDSSQRERLLDRLGLPVDGVKLVLHAAKYAPVRTVRSKGGGNVLTPYQSLKMQRTIETESRHLEFPAAVGHEHDPTVLEYFAQPCRLKFEVVDADGEIHAVDHTPDFLVITEHGVALEEWKHWRKLEGLSHLRPWRYQLDPAGRWRAPGVEQWLGERGIRYRIRTDRDIPERRIENTLFLEDYLHPSAPACSKEVCEKVREALAVDPALFLADVYEQIGCRPDDIFKLIADGQLVADIDHASLAEPTRCRVFRDTAVREFEHARVLPPAFALPGTLDIVVGARLTYDQQPYTVVMVGGTKVVLESDQKKTIEVALDTLEALAARKDITMAQECSATAKPTRLSDFTEAELRIALKRKTELEHLKKPNRTERRHLKMLATARLTGAEELVALVPRLRDRGNRTPRLSEAQEAALEQVIRDEYLTSRASNPKHCHRKLITMCAERGIRAPSYPTLISRIKAISQQKADRSRHGNRVAYQNSEFIDVLYVDTPVHGSRAFQYVHLDHTELDIELVSEKTGKALGRPWISLAIDTFTRRILGMYLSYDPPSYRSNMMLLRDIVRRFRRLPQFIVVDNGADFRSEDFARFAELMGVHMRFRPAGRPRHGAVMERIFGRANTEYIHNLAGNTKATKEVRRTTGKFMPSRLAEWTLFNLYCGLDYWAFTYYDEHEHPALGVSPREAFERSMASSGIREHRVVTLTQDFLILSCPTVTRMGERTVDRQRGIKVSNQYHYWCPEFRDPKLDGKKVPARFDPWDGSTVYVQIDKRWVPARCKALAALGHLTMKERELLTSEMQSRFRLGKDAEVSVQRLTEFMRTFTPSGAVEVAFERQQENRSLYQSIGIAAISPPSPRAPILSGTRAESTAGQHQTGHLPPTTSSAEESTADLMHDDTPDFDIF